MLMSRKIFIVVFLFIGIIFIKNTLFSSNVTNLSSFDQAMFFKSYRNVKDCDDQFIKRKLFTKATPLDFSDPFLLYKQLSQFSFC